MTEINAALDAAAMAHCMALAKVNECEPKACRVPCQWCADGSAAAIAAFLRAWPNGCDPMFCDCGSPDLAKLAAAIEQARKEAT